MRNMLLTILSIAALLSCPATASEQPNPCLIVKHKGTVGRRLIWFAATGLPIAPGSKYDYVDSVSYQSKKVKFGEKDLHKIQDNGIHVIILNNKFTSGDLDSARASCMTPSTAATTTRLTEAKAFGVSGSPEESGFQVTSVAKNSPAERGKIKPGDVISKIDGIDIHTALDIETAIAASAKPTVRIISLVETAGIGITQFERETKVPRRKK